MMRIYYNFIILLISYFFMTILFMNGFLLRRNVIPINSSCSDTQFNENRNFDCWNKKLYKKVIILVIDALRFDFVNEINEDKKLKLYQNRFIHLSGFLKNNSTNSRLFSFIADPPTTTLQRLKGLITGSLPTFIDTGSNFASPEINEDNFMDQMIKSNLKIFFAGDDTWVNLFPNRFHKSFPFPSFNVKDLDTVDNGVIKTLIPALETNEFDVCIGHMLGVDHCGHTYGPNHYKMIEKLTLVDNLIKDIIEKMNNDSVLFVLGDHGMTEYGDHGGDSKDEVTAALFVFSKKPLFYNITKSLVEQVDLVPTLSLLLGLPIPFQNLGTYITSLTPQLHSTLHTYVFSAKALHINVFQVIRYIHKIETDLLSKEQLLQFDVRVAAAEVQFRSIMERIEVSHSGKEYISRRYKYEDEMMINKLVDLMTEFEDIIKEIREICRRTWAQFDLVLISSSLVLMPFVLFFNLSFIIMGPNSAITFIGLAIVTYFTCFLFLMVIVMRWGMFYVLIVFLCCSPIMLLMILLIYGNQESHEVKFSILSVLSRIDFAIFLVYFLYLFSLFSNSFVVYEGNTSKYLFLSVLLLQFIYQVITNKEIVSADIKRPFKKQSYRTIIPLEFIFKLSLHLLFICLCIRISAIFENCREEEINCSLSDFVQSLTSFSVSNKSSIQNLCFVGIMVLLFSLSIYSWLRSNGNLWRHTLLTYAAYAYPIFNIFLVAYWCMQYVMAYDYNLSNPLARVILLYSLVCFFLPFICDPIMAFTTLQKFDLTRGLNSNEVSIPDLFNTLKNKFQHKNQEEPTILAYGLSTMLSSVHFVMLSGLLPTLSLLLSPTHALAIHLLMVVTVVMQRMFAQRNNYEEIKFVPWSHVLICSMLSSVYFHATGHETTIASIRWGAAFHGTTPDSFSLFPALLVVANTFGAHIFMSLATPLLIYSSTKEVQLVENPAILMSLVFDLSLKNIFVYALRLCTTMLVAVIHQRHLMVWKIFAPRLVYEVITFIIVIFCNIFNICLFSRLKVKIIQFLEKMATSVL